MSDLDCGSTIELRTHAAARGEGVGVGQVGNRLDLDQGHVDAELVGHHLAHFGVDALAHLDAAMRDGDAAVLGEDGHEAVELDTPALDKVAVPNMKELSQYERLCSNNNPYFHIVRPSVHSLSALSHPSAWPAWSF